MNRIFAIGDIHGKFDMLEAALDFIETLRKPEDVVIFLGDYIDRGDKSKQVIDKIIEYRKKYPNTITLRGNHEQFCLDAQNDPEQRQLWIYNGGYSTVPNYPNGKVSEEHLNFMSKTKMEHKTKSFRFVHAGFLPPGETWEYDGDLDPRIWIREPFISSKHIFKTGDVEKRVVFGHTVYKDGPLVRPGRLGIDQGAAYGGFLTTVVLNDENPDFATFIIVDQENQVLTTQCMNIKEAEED